MGAIHHENTNTIVNTATTASPSNNIDVVRKPSTTTIITNDGKNITMGNVSVWKSPNTTIVVGSYNGTRGNGKYVAPERVWPKDFTPSRTVVITFDCRKEVGEIDERVETLGPDEHVKFILSGGWSTKTYTSKCLDPALFDMALDEKVWDPANGHKHTTARTVHYRNRSLLKSMEVGFRGTRLEEDLGMDLK